MVCGKVWIWVFDASALGSWGACHRVGAFVVDAAVAAVLPYGVTWSVAGLQFPAATFSSFLFFLFSFL